MKLCYPPRMVHQISVLECVCLVLNLRPFICVCLSIYLSTLTFLSGCGRLVRGGPEVGLKIN
jgi:hypothetical protein